MVGTAKARGGPQARKVHRREGRAVAGGRQSVWGCREEEGRYGRALWGG